MKIYEFEVMSIGTYVIINLNDRSGCSDIEKDCWQEAVFRVAAVSFESAVWKAYIEYEKLNKAWTNSCDVLYYNPIPLSVEEDDSESGEEILDYWFKEPRDGDGALCGPKKYSKQI